MPLNHENILPLLESVKIDRWNVCCYFKCETQSKVVVSIVPFEPYEGKIKFKWYEILFSPIKSYNRFYHTPITIYSNECHETIVLKAFEKVADHFRWDKEKNQFIFV